MIPTRAQAYRLALAKVAGRRFDTAGHLILSEGERTVLRGLVMEDYADAFQREIAVRQAMMWFDAVFRAHAPQSAP